MSLFGCAPKRPLDYSGSAGLLWALNGAGGVGPSVERDFWRLRATALVRKPASLGDEQRDLFTRNPRHCARAASGHMQWRDDTTLPSRGL
jgi:hypothetical protein